MPSVARPPLPIGLALLGWTVLGVGSWLMLVELVVWLRGRGVDGLWLATCASLPLLGVACLRGWGAVRWAWLLWHGLLLASFFWTSLTGEGETLWVTTSGYAALYALAACVLLSPPARAFFRLP